jgi:hypothetical protein
VSEFFLTSASVPGREHTRLMRNNQDGVGCNVERGVAVAVVTDGCGSGSSSEVGARLGAWYLAAKLPQLAREHGLGPHLAALACDGLAEWMGSVVAPTKDEALAAWVSEQLLFTVLCAVMDARKALVFGIGDGVWSVDGAPGTVLVAAEDNAPDYLGYRLVPKSLLSTKRAVGVPAVHFFGEAQQLAVSTDGLAGDPAALEKICADKLIWRNPVALQRRLNVMATKDKVLHDDTTVAVIKRGGTASQP